MLLRAGPEGALDQQRIVRVSGAIEPAWRLLRLVREGPGRPAHIALPGRRRAAAFGDIARFLAAGFFEHDGRIALARVVEANHRGQLFARDLDRGESG